MWPAPLSFEPKVNRSRAGRNGTDALLLPAVICSVDKTDLARGVPVPAREVGRSPSPFPAAAVAREFHERRRRRRSRPSRAPELSVRVRAKGEKDGSRTVARSVVRRQHCGMPRPRPHRAHIRLRELRNADRYRRHLWRGRPALPVLVPTPRVQMAGSRARERVPHSERNARDGFPLEAGHEARRKLVLELAVRELPVRTPAPRVQSAVGAHSGATASAGGDGAGALAPDGPCRTAQREEGHGRG
mmetsp:Transcript_15488/g.50926  ORF Transcript_15488/g.50926 Transcript_15488/m.50926 type:complete len:245 (+) Transcript_15488:993-1727(+)